MVINKKIFIVILFIIFISGYALIQHNNISKNTVNNTSNISKNISFNKINNSNNTCDNSTNLNDSLNNQNSNPVKDYNYKINKKSKNKSSEITADDILKRVKKGVVWDDGHGGSTQNVKLGKPYKYDDLWLVGAFNKKTGKFLGAVWVASEGGYINGPDSYSDYKDIISGKNSHKSDSYKHDIGNKSNHVVEEIPDSSDFYVLAKANPNISISPIDSLLNLNINNYSSLDVNQENLNEEQNIEMNSTC